MAGFELLSAEQVARLPQQQRREVMELQAEYLQILEANPLLRYKPNGPKYEAFHASRHKIRAAFGGNRSGKSTMALVQDIIDAAPREVVPEWLKPFKKWDCPFYCRIMAPDLERTMKPVIFETLKKWMPPSMYRGGTWEKAYDGKAMCLYLSCGCRFDFLSYEMKLDKFGGAALHRCNFDEEPPQDIRTECLLRLADFNGDEIFAMTPLQGLSWTHGRFWLPRDTRPDVLFVERLSIYDNETLSAEGVAAVEQELKAEIQDGGDYQGDDEQALAEVRRRLHGEFVNVGGMVYPTMSTAKVAPPDPAWVQEQDIVVGIDPGIVAAGLVWIAFDADNQPFVFHTAKLHGKTTDDYAERIRKVNAQWGLPLPREKGINGKASPMYVIDPAARSRSVVTGETIQMALVRAGVDTQAGDNDVEGGVSHVRDLLKAGRLKVSADCKQWWDEAAIYRILERDDTVFQVVKQRDHVMDAGRYGLLSRPWKPWERPREETPYPSGVASDIAEPPPKKVPQSHVLGSLV